jgi:hypothetical protein
MLNSELLIKSIVASFSDMSTHELEKFIEKRYKEKAPQSEIDKLENEYATRVSEDDLDMSEGISLEEQLRNMYHRYITPKDRGGMEEEDIINNMRSAIDSYRGTSSNFSDKQILDAAKDVYMHRKNLLLKYKQKRLK